MAKKNLGNGEINECVDHADQAGGIAVDIINACKSQRIDVAADDALKVAATLLANSRSLADAAQSLLTQYSMKKQEAYIASIRQQAGV